MKTRAVEFHEDANSDLLDLYDWIADAASHEVALGYLERIEAYCLGFEFASERGQLREDVRPGLRVVGFEERVVIAFAVEEERVLILRVFYGGQDCEGSFGS